MKAYSYIFAIALMTGLFSCTKDNNSKAQDEVKELQLTTTLTNSTHKLELYTQNGKFTTGYNAIFIQAKDLDGNNIEIEQASWKPIMHMTSMSHACPYSSIQKKADATHTYEGFIVFQMAGNDMEGWEISIDYTANGADFTATAPIQVLQAEKRRSEAFKGSDDTRYILALVEPTEPKVGINDMKAILYKMENMMSFVPVTNYSIEIDPRMPGMGNHGSPNNVHLSNVSDGFYNGKLSLTMTGYWKINLRLLDASQTVLKGEIVDDNNESSSIYFEIEF